MCVAEMTIPVSIATLFFFFTKMTYYKSCDFLGPLFHMIIKVILPGDFCALTILDFPLSKLRELFKTCFITFWTFFTFSPIFFSSKLSLCCLTTYLCTSSPLIPLWGTDKLSYATVVAGSLDLLELKVLFQSVSLETNVCHILVIPM